MSRLTHTENTLVISYLTLRRVLGALGMLMPCILALGGLLIFDRELQTSLSAYYHTGMRDVFVGGLCAMGFFLCSYTGPERIDNIVSNLAAVFVFGVALLPTGEPGTDLEGSTLVIHHLHSLFAALYFSCLAIFCLHLFTKSNSPQLTPQKLRRNRVYRVCGCTMIVSMVLMIVVMMVLDEKTREPILVYKPVFWLETIALVAFGISWLVKGEAILKDD